MRFEFPVPHSGNWNLNLVEIRTWCDSEPRCSPWVRIRNNRVNLQSDRHRQWDKELAVEFQ